MSRLCEARCVVVTLVLLAVGIARTSAWGHAGHEMIADVAQTLLTRTSNQEVWKVLNSNMSSVANWADSVDHEEAFKWSDPLHFINVVGDTCDFVYARDCKDHQGNLNFCVAGAINNYTNILVSGKGDTPREALSFLIHFVGDIHQPLHCGFDKDRGGHYDVTFYGEDTNLHAVWDFGIINRAIDKEYAGKQDAFTQHVLENMRTVWKDEVVGWTKNCTAPQCSTPWGEESIQAACKWAYQDAPAGAALGYDYYVSRLPEIQKLIAKAGARLAHAINKIF